LKFITSKRAEYILAEIHEGVCGNHSGARTMATKVLRASYYWLTVQGDCAEYVKKCAKCQERVTVPSPSHKAERATQHYLPMVVRHLGHGHYRSLFARKGQTKFLLVRVDYFTKWI